MYGKFQEHLNEEIKSIRDDGLFKNERQIGSPQGSEIKVGDKPILNLCANNYLGLAQHPQVNAAAKKGLDDWGYGMASVRFICGTQTLHKQLEDALSTFLGMESTILYPSCFDANGGLFETLLSEKDAVISDSLNHASIIDGIRLCKASRYRYNNNDMTDLEDQLKKAHGARFKLITTDGVFSMDGSIAKLGEICDLADQYEAMVHFDDCHATGFIGETGRGTHEYRGCMNRVDIITGTLGKALGGGSGGFTSARKEIVELLRQRSRPYLFSNTVAPPIAAGALKAIEIARESSELRKSLRVNTALLREGLEKLRFTLLPGGHPIVPVMFESELMASKFADALFEEGIYAVAFSYPVVPHGKARIRIQVNAALTVEDIQHVVKTFGRVKVRLDL